MKNALCQSNLFRAITLLTKIPITDTHTDVLAAFGINE